MVVAVAGAGAGAVSRGMDVLTVLIPSALEGSQPEVGDSVCLSQVVVTTFPLQDCCRIWESHRDVETEPSMSEDRRPARAVCPVTEVELTATVSPETETVEDMIRMLLPTPAPTTLQAVPIRSDQDLRMQQLM